VKALVARLRLWGWPGLVGVVCLLLAGFIACGPGADWDAAARTTARAADALQARAGEAHVAARPAGAAAEAQQLVAVLPGVGEREVRLAGLLALAEKQLLRATQTELTMLPKSALGSERLLVAQPLTGSYEGLRAMLEEALLADPALSLDRLRLARPAADTNELEIELVWSLHQRGAEILAGNPP
jgi:hypothetical protein